MYLVWIASYYTQWASNPITATKSNCSHAKTCPHSLCGELVSGKGTTEVSEQAERPGFHFHSCNPQGWHANLSPVSSPGHRLDGQSWVGVMPWEKWRGRACCTAFNCVLAWIVPSQIHIHLETWMWWVKLKWSHTGFMCVHLCMFSCSVTMSDSITHGLWPTRFLWLCNSPSKNTAVGSHSLLPGIFPTQGLNLGLLYCRWVLYHLSYWGSPWLQ